MLDSLKKVAVSTLYGISVLSLMPACYGQTFAIAATPSSVTILPGQQNVPVTVNATSGTYKGPINVTMTGLPSGITPSPLTLTAGNSGTVLLSASLSAGQEGFPASGPMMQTGWTVSVTVVGAAGSAQATAPISLTVSISNPSFAPAASAINLPIARINTSGVPIVSKTDDIAGTITITSADGQTSYLPNASDSDNTATFHVHGSSTALMPKLAYEVSLTTGVDLLNTMGLVCPYVTNGKGNPTCDHSKSYVLLANYDDKTLLRDWSASALANAIPIGSGYLNSPADSPTPSGTSVLMPWAAHSLFVELYLNGVYEGNYQLIEAVKVDSHRIDIDELTATDTAPSQVTGGYLLEIDQEMKEAYMFETPQNLPIGLVDPDFSSSPQVSEQTSYISNYVGVAETALFSSKFTDPILGWRAYFDEASAINFYIVNDVMGNVDGGDFYSSDYLYKNDNNPLIYMGPIWDFDISSGNVNYETIVNPTVPWMQTAAAWYVQWFQDPGFRADVVTQWNTLMQNGVFTAWLTSIQQQAGTLAQSQANNFGRWPMQGIEVWPNPEAAGSYRAEVQYLTNWLKLRIAYLDSLFNVKAQTNTVVGVSSGNESAFAREPAASLRSDSDVTLSAQVTGGSTPTGTEAAPEIVTFLCNNVIVGTASLNGGTASLTVNLPGGTDNLQAVYNGDTGNSLSSSALLPLIVAAPRARTVTSVAAGPSASTFTVSVIGESGTAVPTGTIAFIVHLGSDRADGGQGTAVALNAAGQATYSLSGPAPTETYAIGASYSGDLNYSPSSGSVTVPASAP